MTPKGAGAHAVQACEIDRKPQPIAVFFALLPQFSMLSFASAFEVFRIANSVAGREIFAIRICSVGGAPVQSASGLVQSSDCGLDPVPKGSIVFAIGGAAVQQATSASIGAWLRYIVRIGSHVGGLCTGAYVLAKAGLLEGKSAAIHWENQDAFAEEFPDISLEKRAFTIDGAVSTSSGGTTSIDLALELISLKVSEKIASEVAAQLNYQPVRDMFSHFNFSLSSRLNIRNPVVTATIKLMEENIETPVTSLGIERSIGVSIRQVERLFHKHLQTTPKRYYMGIRLARAHALLCQTNLSIIEVGLACGFSSPSHFSKCFRLKFDKTPYSLRR